MNWTGNMECNDAEQILLLLKSSDCIMHDLTEPFDHCEDVDNDNEDNNVDYYLVLRKWNTIHPSSEFRCFVSHNQLVGVSQRNYNTYFDFLKEHSSNIKNAISTFFEDNLKEKFKSSACKFIY